jgi:hypothetical protein
MCEEWWDERLLQEQAEKLKRRIPAPTAEAEPGRQDKPDRRPQEQPDPVPV